jgi:hypothetical protein
MQGDRDMPWAKRIILAAVLLVSAGSASSASVPWKLFDDTLTNSRCDLVNAENVQLVVLREDGALTIVTGVDVLIQGSVVDAQDNVLISGEPRGFIAFAEDAQGYRKLWWVLQTGRVVHIDGLTGEVTESDKLPSDFSDVSCSACPLWDEDLQECNIPTEITVQPQGATVCLGSDVTLIVEAVGSDIVGYEWFKNGQPISGEESSRLPLGTVGLFDTATYHVNVISGDGSRVASEPATLVVGECGSSSPGLNLCGLDSVLALTLTIVGLTGMSVARRRLG